TVRSGSTAAVFAICIAALAACGDRADSTPAEGDSIIVTDDAGRTVMLERPARRVISMIPAQTEIVMIVAGADALVARTRWDEDPRLAHLPSIGNALTPSIEWLVAQRPDLVIAWPDAQSRDVVQRLSDVGIPVYASSVESVAQIRSMIERLGVLLGERARADSLVLAIDDSLAAVRADVAHLPSPRVLYLLSSDPPMVAGPGTFIDDLITIAGGENVFADVRHLWPQVSLEELVRRQPDVIIRPSDQRLDDPLTGLADRPGWRELRAVQQHRVHVVDPDLYNRAGVTVGAAARGLARRIHAATPAATGGLPRPDAQRDRGAGTR
ncbi:MAG TPA: helical backbone metal receptor, partial [Longimicrobiales bacterium]|nr:helical backbone metal receptor [Longimicrobiales bacterium]